MKKQEPDATMPIYPSEKDIARAVLGPERAREWPGTAKFLEDKFNLPKVDPLMGGRHWPSVQRFFDQRHGLVVISADEATLQPSSHIRIIPSPPDIKVCHNEPQAETVGYRGPDRRSRRPRP